VAVHNLHTDVRIVSVYEYPSIQELRPCDFFFNFPVMVAKHFPGRWIGRRGPTEWPLRNPGLVACDFFYGVDQKRESVGQNQVHFSWNNKFEVFLPLFFALHKEER
jgi:hypothetical protein